MKIAQQGTARIDIVVPIGAAFAFDVCRQGGERGRFVTTAAQQSDLNGSTSRDAPRAFYADGLNAHPRAAY
jgi:hypothetical protein